MTTRVPTPRILLLSLYYPPDQGAGAFRAEALANALLEQEHCELHVVTAMPGRYASWNPVCEPESRQGRLYIRRLRLPKCAGAGIIGQSLAMLWFMLRVRWLLRKERYDLVVATSSRLLTATLGAWIAGALRAPLYLDIRDIFVENLSCLLPGRTWQPLLRLLNRMEQWTIGRAAQVNLVSKGFAGYFMPRYPGRTFSYFTNGIDPLFMQQPDTQGNAATPSCNNRPLTLLYAGNIGDGQALEQIVPQLALQLGQAVRFRIIGDGSRLPVLLQQLQDLDVQTVEVLPPLHRAELVEQYRQADVLFLHLNDVAAFHRVLPSKLFEYAASGKPVLAGVAGHAAAFVRSEIDNAAVFRPGNVNDAVAQLAGLQPVTIHRKRFMQSYARRHIMRHMAADILSLTRS